MLDFTLPYEPQPHADRRVDMDGENADVFMVAHWARARADAKVTLSSAFSLEAPWPNADESLVLTCAHTLEEASYPQIYGC